MTAARRHGPLGPATGWWATAARALALVLAIALAAPAAGLADDIAFHAGHRAHERTASVAPAGPDGSGSQADPGVAGHVHCGCQVAARLDGTEATPPSATPRPSYAPAAEAVPSVFPDRLPRPPRA